MEFEEIIAKFEANFDRVQKGLSGGDLLLNITVKLFTYHQITVIVCHNVTMLRLSCSTGIKSRDYGGHLQSLSLEDFLISFVFVGRLLKIIEHDILQKIYDF